MKKLIFTQFQRKFSKIQGHQKLEKDARKLELEDEKKFSITHYRKIVVRSYLMDVLYKGKFSLLIFINNLSICTNPNGL